MIGLTEDQADQLQQAILDHNSCGAEAFHIKDAYEIHPRGYHDFPEPIQNLLASWGFQRTIDKLRGPFYWKSE